jgi:hypothetical protein
MRWIVGDVHGMLRSLERLVAAVRAADPAARLIFAGDYVNRGPDSRGVIDLLLSLAAGGAGAAARFVRGNHDDVFDQVLSGENFTGETGLDNRAAAFQWFMQHGLEATFRSYGATNDDLNRAMRRPTEMNLEFLASLVPDNHRAFVRELPPVVEDDDLFVAHAKWDIYTPDHNPPIAQRLPDPKVRQRLLWGRYSIAEIAEEKFWRRPGYFGHTPSQSYGEGAAMPVLGPHIALLDTGLALVDDGRLTAFCHETGQFLQADRDGRIVVTP